MQGAWVQSLGWEILHVYGVAMKKKKKQTNKITEQKQTKNMSSHCAQPCQAQSMKTEHSSFIIE